MFSSELLPSFLGALQASLSVILTISYGVVAGQFDLLDQKTGKTLSKICVRMFMPALLITRIGAELDSSTVGRYVPILIWSLIYILLSLGLGVVATKLFKFPFWVTLSLGFNNTTSLPLLLIQALDATGILERLITKDETSTDLIKRAKSYFLVSSIVANCLTFAVGPRLLDAEHSPDKKLHKSDGPSVGDYNVDSDGHVQDGEAAPNEETSLLPNWMRTEEIEVEGWWHRKFKHWWDQRSPRTQALFSFLGDFCNAPLVGALIGAFIGLVPPLHKAFFNRSNEGGWLNAWLTTSLEDIGDLFVTLQVVVVGVSLGTAMRKMKRGEASGSIPWIPCAFVLFVRFLLWPVASIAIIYMIALKTSWLSDDPMLWFAMMLMPTGPPAMKLVAMAECADAEEDELMSISKFLTLSYAVVPLMAFAVVGSLRASEIAIGNI